MSQVAIVAGCLIALVSFGVRSSFGLFTEPLTAASGWGREVYALAIAIQNLVWGLAQPLAGALADRYGPVRVLVAGGALFAAGTAVAAFDVSPLGLYLGPGVLAGLGMSGAAFASVLAAFGRLVPEAQRSWAFGLATAAASLGQFLVVPLAQAVMAAFGWRAAVLALAALVAVIPLLATTFGGATADPMRREPDGSALAALRAALGRRSYLLLVGGFFVCGFQVSFITVHMPPYLVDVGIGATMAAFALGLVGLFNVVGGYASGVLGGRRSRTRLLSAIYLGRAVAIAAFVLVPVSPTTVAVFSVALGMLWMSTAPLTSGLVVALFGTRHLATLFGVVFLGHQVGAFLGVWLGGVVFARTGSYEIAWWTAVGLAVLAAVAHVPIRETRAVLQTA
jgi:MFS family permease